VAEIQGVPPASDLRAVPVTECGPRPGFARRSFIRSALSATAAAFTELHFALDGKGDLDKVDEFLTKARERVLEAQRS